MTSKTIIEWNNLYKRHSKCPLGCTEETCKVGKKGEAQERIDFIKEQLTLAEKRGEEKSRKKIIEKIKYKFENAKSKLYQPLTIALIKQIIFELKAEIITLPNEEKHCIYYNPDCKICLTLKQSQEREEK